MRRPLRGLVFLLLLTPSCYLTTHTVGGGPTGADVVQARQWYWMFGYFRIPPYVDSENLAGNSTSYRVTTRWGFLDVLMNIITSVATIQSRTIVVEK